MKKNIWFRYGSGGETIEIIIRDGTGAKIESWKLDSRDKKRLVQVYQRVMDKYNINLFQKTKKKQGSDLDWIS